jgi:hypothetical protein
MPPSNELLTLAMLAVSLAVAAGLVWVAAKVHSLERRLTAATGDPRVLERLTTVEREQGAVGGRLDHLAGRVDRIGEETQRCLRRVGIVRYDAFKELGGHLSFSLALLDARQDGVVVSVLNDRNGARAYAKPVAGGRSTITLSEEEQRAITQS